MTPKEAIDVIEIAIAEVEWEYPMDYAAAFDMAIDALKKQVPKKPRLKQETSLMHINRGDMPHEFRRTEWMKWCCPKCDGFVGERVSIRGGEREHDQCKKLFCESCGQAIEWSETEG